MVNEFAMQSAITFKRVLLQKFILVEVFISEKLYRECNAPVRQEKTLLRIPVRLKKYEKLILLTEYIILSSSKMVIHVYNI